MPFWDREPFQTLISEEHYGFVDSGPLQAPISTFKLRRNEKLQLRLETVCGEEAVHNHHLLERQNLDDEEQQKAQLKSIGGLVVDLSGVISESIRTEESYRRNESKLRETAHVHSIQSQIAKEGARPRRLNYLIRSELCRTRNTHANVARHTNNVVP